MDEQQIEETQEETPVQIEPDMPITIPVPSHSPMPYPYTPE